MTDGIQQPDHAQLNPLLSEIQGAGNLTDSIIYAPPGQSLKGLNSLEFYEGTGQAIRLSDINSTSDIPQGWQPRVLHGTRQYFSESLYRDIGTRDRLGHQKVHDMSTYFGNVAPRFRQEMIHGRSYDPHAWRQSVAYEQLSHFFNDRAKRWDDYY